VARTLKQDRLLFAAMLILLAISMTAVYSASTTAGWSVMRTQLKALALGVVALVVTMKLDYTHYRHFRVVGLILLAALVALVLVLVIGKEVNGGRRWIVVGTNQMQPSEVAKIAMILFTAYFLERRMDRIDDPKYALLPIGAGLAAVAGLVYLENDLGTTVAIVGVAVVMVFAAGLAWKHMAMALGVLLPALALFIYLHAYRMERILAFLDPESDPLKTGYQPLQSMIAVGTGGITGVGLGDSVQKRFFLPEAHSDFIYAVIGEETGLIGATIVLLCFGIIVWRGIRTSLRAPDRFASLVALGITMMIGAQAFVNMSVVLALLPTKGIPLPFVSAGGSSLVVSLLAMGILLNISQHASAEVLE
jgi:cell division protein FtsW